MSQGKPNRSIEELFRSILRRAEKAGKPEGWNVPDQDMWSRIESHLPKERKRRFIILPWLLSGLLLVFVIVLINQNSDLKQEDVAMSNQQVENGSQLNSSNTADASFSTVGDNKIDHQVVSGQSPKPAISDLAASDTDEMSSKMTGQTSIDETGTYRDVIDEKLASETSLGESRATPNPGSQPLQILTKGNVNVEVTDKIQLGNELSSTGSNEKETGIQKQSTVQGNANGIATDNSALDNKMKDSELVSIRESGYLVESIEQRDIRLFDVPTRESEEREVAAPQTRVINQSSDRLRITFAYAPAYTSCKNLNGYYTTAEITDIQDWSNWSDAFAVSAQLPIGRQWSLNGGVRYSAFQYETAFFVSLPYDRNAEVENSYGNFQTGFRHSFPSPVGLISADYGVWRAADDEIPQNTAMDMDLVARHQLNMLEFPISLNRNFSINDRWNFNAGAGIVTSFILSNTLNASSFASHHESLHHWKSGFSQDEKRYENVYFSGMAQAGIAYAINPILEAFVSGGYEFGLTNVYQSNYVESKTTSIRFNTGVSFRLK